MTKREHIAALEKRIDALEREVASIPRWHWTDTTAPYTYPPLRVGDGAGGASPFVSPTVTWASFRGNSAGVNQ